MTKKKAPKKEKPRVHPELEGFDIKINKFGEVITNYDLDKINTFLNKHVDDKKLRDRDDVEGRDYSDTEDMLEEDYVEDDFVTDDEELPNVDEDLKDFGSNDSIGDIDFEDDRDRL